MRMPDDDCGPAGPMAPAPARVRRFGSLQSQLLANQWRRAHERERADAAHARLIVWTAWLAASALAVSTARIVLAVLAG